ncbi:MAG: succinate dehydrogenase, cytochrome b556 subunit [Anaerolineae bacterium]|nr:succinate dehydrogenase, cytochrome b556 subunit [Anaerolineae bacterium]
MTSLVTTVTETLRYRGKLGQWSWAFHRVSGLGVLLFLVIHVIDTSWVYFFPELYEGAIRIYQTPLFTLGEFALVAAVVYHAFNGLRIVLFDYKPEWWQYQARAAQIVFLASAVVLVPVFVLMFQHVVEFYSGRPFDLGVGVVIAEVALPFGGGMIVALLLGVALSFGVGAVTGNRGTAAQRLTGRSRFEQFMWLYMRVSGVLLVVLAIGHLLIMHVINGVFDINAAQTGQAANFVAARWAFLGWRIYDAGLLILAIIHGMNGLRYVIGDYTSHPTVRRGLTWAVGIGALALIVVGGMSLIGGVPGM